MQPLELAFRQGLEVDAPNALLDTRALQPTEKNLGSTRIRVRALTQAPLDLRITRRLTETTRCAEGLSDHRRLGHERVRVVT